MTLSLLGTTLNLGLPSALWLAAFAPLLILAYRRRIQSTRLLVSSTLFLRKLSPKRQVTRRIKIPPRFFLELLILLLVVASATKPQMIEPQRHLAIVLDNSLSMRTASSSATNEGSDRITRFDSAQLELNTWLASADKDQVYSLFTVSPKLQRIGQEKLPLAQARTLITSIKPSWTKDSLSLALRDLAQSAEYGRIVVFTDRRLQNAGQEKTTLGELPHKTTPIEVFSLGEGRENIYLTNIELLSSSGQTGSGQKQVRAELGFSGQLPIDVVASLATSGKTGEADSFLTSKELQLFPGKTTELLLGVNVGTTDKAQVLRLEVGPAKREEASRNALLQDDVAWVAQSNTSDAKLLLVSPAAGNKTLGLQGIPAFSIDSLTPEQYAAQAEAELYRYNLLIFHRTAPSSLPRSPALLILPPSGNGFADIAQEVSDPKFTSWAEDSPLTRYLRIPLLSPTTCLVFDKPDWGKVIISTERGPTLVAGELNGNKLAALGFELLPFEGRKTPASSILLLNIINWLSDLEDLQAGYVTGANLRLESGKTWIIRSPDGKLQTLTPQGEETLNYFLEQAGPYVRSSILPDTNQVSQARTELLPVNAFHPEESLTATFAPLDLPQDALFSTAKIESGSPIWPLLLSAVLCLLLLDLLFALIPRRQQISEAKA